MCVVGDEINSPYLSAGSERSRFRFRMCSVVAQLSERLVAWTRCLGISFADFYSVFVYGVCAFFFLFSFFTSASRFVNNLIFMTCSCAFSLRIYKVIIFSWVTIYLQFSFSCSSVHTLEKVSAHFLLVLVASALESDEHDFVIIDNIFIRCSTKHSVIVIASHDLLVYSSTFVRLFILVRLQFYSFKLTLIIGSLLSILSSLIVTQLFYYFFKA